jgi:hypothetical protein
MTGNQSSEIIRHLGNGARLREAAALVHLPWPDFARVWREGRAASEAGTENDSATWYREAAEARARHIATVRAEARATAGSRESADLLAYAKSLESEDEPLSVESSEDRHGDPFSTVSAMIDAGDVTPELAAAYECATRACLDFFHEYLQAA